MRITLLTISFFMCVVESAFAQSTEDLLSENNRLIESVVGRIQSQIEADNALRSDTDKLSSHYANTAHAVKGLRGKIRKIQTRLNVAERSFENLATLQQAQSELIAKVSELRGLVDNLNAGNLQPALEERILTLINARVEEANSALTEQLSALEQRVSSVEKLLTRPRVGLIALATFPTTANVLGADVGIDVPLPYGELTLSLGLGYGGSYEDLETMGVVGAVGYLMPLCEGIAWGPRVTWLSTHAFSRLKDDETPTTFEAMQGGIALEWRPDSVIIGAEFAGGGASLLGEGWSGNGMIKFSFASSF